MRLTQLRERLDGAGPAPFVALAFLVLVGAWAIARVSLDNHYIFNDEGAAMIFGRSIGYDSSLLFTDGLSRGPERLMSVIFALISVTVTDAWRQVDVLHVVSATMQAAVAVPAFAAARLLGLNRWQALAPAVICAASLAFYGIFTLNTAAGMLCGTAMLWAMVRSIVRPGLVSDGLILATVALTAVARVGWAPLVVALAPATLAAAWFARPSGESLRDWLRAAPRVLLRRHPVLLPLAGLALVAVLVRGPENALGTQYGVDRFNQVVTLDLLVDNTKLVLAHLGIAVALVPLIIALPAIGRDLVRPREPHVGAFAWLVLGTFVLFSYAYYSSVNEDRYLAILAPPLVLAGAVAAFRHRPPVWALVLSGLVLTRLVVTAAPPPGEGPIDYFVAPTTLFFDRALAGELSVRMPILSSHAATLLCLAAVVGAVVVAGRPLATAGRARLAAMAVVLVGIVGTQALAADHVADKFIAQIGSPGLTSDELAFIDVATEPGDRAEPLVLEENPDPYLLAQLLTWATRNERLASGLPAKRSTQDEGMGTAAMDVATGRVEFRDDPPEVVLTAGPFTPVGFAGDPLPVPAVYAEAQMTRLEQPMRLAWTILGTGADGYPDSARPVRVRVFPGPGGRCLRGAVVAAADAPPTRYRITGAADPVTGTVVPGTPVPFEIPVGAGRTEVALEPRGPGAEDGAPRPTVGGVSVGPCASG